MLKRMIVASALIAAATTVHAAGTQASTTMPDPTQMFLPAATADEHLASRLIGMDVYSDTAGTETIGNVNDLVIAPNGSVQAVIVGVGGFLGMGEKNVAIAYSDLQWTNLKGTPALVASATKDELQNAPSFDTAALDQQDQNAAAQNNTTMTAPAANGQVAANQQQMNQPMNNMADQTATVDVSKISANDLINTTVYSANNDNVGEVGDVILAKDGTIDAVVIDVGGFLGIGQKPVAIGFDALKIQKDKDGHLVLNTAFTRDELENAPTYDKDAYQNQRDTMRLAAPG